MKTFRQTRNYKLHQAKEIARALAALANPPENIDDLDWNEMKYDPSTSTAFKLRNWYEDNGAVHTGTKKFDFFPFTCGYMVKEL